MKNTFIKLIQFTLIFVLTFSNTAQAITGIDAQERTTEISIDMIKSSEPSDLPVAGVSDFFDKENIHLIRNFDLSSYIGKKVFVGYGVYDKKEDNCKFVEKPGVSKSDYDSTFAYVEKFNQNSYAVSKTRMSYSECQALGDRFGGYPVVLDSAAESMFVASKFSGNTVNSNSIEHVWIGAKKNSCTDVRYTNELNLPQHYENFPDTELSSVCASNKLNLKLDRYGKFAKTSEHTPSYCALEFEGYDIYKPLKICASWWKILRDYPNDDPGLYDPAVLKSINQADIPAQMVICSKYEADSLPPIDQANTRIAHCTEYYSATILPECVLDMHQPQCKVSECGGYIENACRLVDQDTVGKGYVKGEVLKGGVITETKVKDNIVTKEYECPPSNYSNKLCLEQSAVVVYPKECPGSQCQELKECLLAAASNVEAQNTCHENFTCIKITGGRDIPPKVDPVSGDVTHLYANCPAAPISDGSTLEFPVNIEEKIGKTCLEYEMIETTETITQNCVLERPFQDHEVDMAITEIDEYQDNPLCLRMDTVRESIQMEDLNLKIESKGFFKHKATKVYLDGQIETIYNGGSDDYTIGSAMPDMFIDNNNPQFDLQVEEILGAGQSRSFPGTGTIDLDVDCRAYDPSSATGAAWYQKTVEVMNDYADIDSVHTSDPAFNKIDYSGSKGKILIPDSFIDSESDCANYAANHGFSSYLSSYDYSKNIVTGVDYCTLNINKVGADSELSAITAFGADLIKYDFNTNMTGRDCLKKAFCLDGYYNESSFSSLDSNSMCAVTVGEGSPSSYGDLLEQEALDRAGIVLPPAPTGTTKEECTPTSRIENASSELDGVENIFVFEDYLRGGFGYYSNYNSWNAISNKILVSSGEHTDKILPMQPHTKITDYVQYHGILTHESHKSKKPDIPTALMGGAVAGLFVYQYLSFAASTGIIVSLVIFVILMLLAKSKNMDRQYTEYHLYKDIPLDLYNEGMYETRYTNVKAAVSGEKSLHTDPTGYKRLTYQHIKTDTGRFEPGKFLEVLKDLFKHKESTLICAGFEGSEVYRSTHADELSINYGYPKCKWYRPWCEKMDTHKQEVVTNANIYPENVVSPEVPVVHETGGTETNIAKLNKVTGTVYLGATNTLVVLVPYIGDYKLEAFNKYDTLLSTRTMHESSFAGVTDPNGLKFAQVNFGLGMNIAPGLTDGENTNACIKDRAVEWGGGVSGVFYESQRTELSNFCQKSNDTYVKDQAMTTIRVQPLNMDRAFEYKLTAPMPFPNRVWIATLDEREIRNYRCFGKFGECEDEEYREAE